MNTNEDKEKLKEIGTKIKIARIAQKISCGRLAKMVGASPSMIFYWERGEKSPSFLYVKKLEKALGINI